MHRLLQHVADQQADLTGARRGCRVPSRTVEQAEHGHHQRRAECQWHPDRLRSDRGDGRDARRGKAPRHAARSGAARTPAGSRRSGGRARPPPPPPHLHRPATRAPRQAPPAPAPRAKRDTAARNENRTGSAIALSRRQDLPRIEQPRPPRSPNRFPTSRHHARPRASLPVEAPFPELATAQADHVGTTAFQFHRAAFVPDCSHFILGQGAPNGPASPGLPARL